MHGRLLRGRGPAVAIDGAVDPGSVAPSRICGPDGHQLASITLRKPCLQVAGVVVLLAAALTAGWRQ